MKNKQWMILFATLLCTMMVTPLMATAHVTVNPSESSTNAWEKYAVRVPVEKDMNTTEVTLVIPEGILFVSIMPIDNWDYEFEKDESENITSVTWTASEEGIGPNEFIEFLFIASNPGEPGEFSWEAFQTYEDGSVVEWTGEPDSDEPASVTQVVAGDTEAQQGEDGDTTQANTTAATSNWLPISLAAIALLLACISLFRKRTQ